jgi:hypothetical protein
LFNPAILSPGHLVALLCEDVQGGLMGLTLQGKCRVGMSGEPDGTGRWKDIKYKNEELLKILMDTDEK